MNPTLSINYALLVALLTVVYIVIRQFLPDFPIDEGTLMVFILYVLAKLGVEVTGQPVASAIRKFSNFISRK